MTPWLLALLLAPAAAETPPLTQEEARDLPRWEAASRQLIDGPAGCVELRGTVWVTLALLRPGGWLGPGETRTLRSQGTFEGVLKDGTWTRLITTWSPTEGEGDLDLDTLSPLVGRLTEDTETTAEGTPKATATGDEEGSQVSISVGSGSTDVAIESGTRDAMTVLDSIMDSLQSDISLSSSDWDADRQAVVLRQVVPLEERGSKAYQVVTVFPGGGPPTSIDATFPPRMRMDVDAPFKVTLLNAQLHLRGTVSELGVLPTEEGASLVLGVLGYTGGYEQRIRYTGARACPGP